MAEESEDDEMVQLRNTLLASMRSASKDSGKSSRTGCGGRKRRSQREEIYDTDINDLEALREAALRSLKSSDSDTAPDSPQKVTPESPGRGVTLRPSQASLQFPSNTPRFSLSRLSRAPRSNLIVIQPVSSQESFPASQSYSRQPFNDREQRKRTDKWARHRDTSSDSSDSEKEDDDAMEERIRSDSDKEEEEDIHHEDTETNNQDSPHNTEDPRSQGDAAPTPVQDERDHHGNTREFLESRESASMEKERAESSSRSSSSLPSKEEDRGREGKSLRVLIPGALPPSLSRSLDEEMEELEENNDGMFEFLDEDPDEFTAIVTEAKLEEEEEREMNTPDTYEPAPETRTNTGSSGPGSDVGASASGSTELKKEELKSQLAMVDQRLEKLKQRDSRKERERRSSTRDRKEREKEKRPHPRPSHSHSSKEHQNVPAWTIRNEVSNRRRDAPRQDTKTTSSSRGKTRDRGSASHREHRDRDRDTKPEKNCPERKLKKISPGHYVTTTTTSRVQKTTVYHHRTVEGGTSVRERKVEHREERRSKERKSLEPVRRTSPANVPGSAAITGLARGFTLTPHPLMDIKIEGPGAIDKDAHNPLPLVKPASRTPEKPVKVSPSPPLGERRSMKKSQLDLRHLLQKKKQTSGDEEEVELEYDPPPSSFSHHIDIPNQESPIPTLSAHARLGASLSRPVPSFQSGLIPISSDTSLDEPVPVSPRKIMKLKRPSEAFYPEVQPESSGSSGSVGNRSRSPIRAPMATTEGLVVTKKQTTALARLGKQPQVLKGQKVGNKGGKKLKKKLNKELGKAEVPVRKKGGSGGVPELRVQSGNLHRRVVVSDNGEGTQKVSYQHHVEISFIRNTGKIKLKK